MKTSLILLAVFLTACTITITPDYILMQRGGGLPLISTNTPTNEVTIPSIPPPPLITPAPPTPTQEVAILACVANPNGVNVRSGHNTLAPIVGVLRVNDCVRWIATEAGWYYVEYGAGYAWVAGWLMRME